MPILTMDMSLPAKPLATDPDLYSEATVIYNAIRILAQSHDDLINEIAVTAFETMAVGQMVALYNDAGIGKARLALDGTYFAIGFCGADVSAGSTARVFLRGKYPTLAVASLTPAAKYYLSNAVAGSITLGPTTQIIGVAQSDTTLIWKPQL